MLYYKWSYGQAVKTQPSHGWIRGSIPLEATKGENGIFARFRFFFKKQKPRPNICFRPFATKRNSCFTSSWSRLIAMKQMQRRYFNCASAIVSLISEMKSTGAYFLSRAPENHKIFGKRSKQANGHKFAKTLYERRLWRCTFENCKNLSFDCLT